MLLKIYIESSSHVTFLGDQTKSDRLPLVYAHGELQDMAGFDLLCLAPGTKFDRLPRIEDVTAVLPNGTEVPARMYYWIDSAGRNRGFVVKQDDHQAKRYAAGKFSAKSCFL